MQLRSPTQHLVLPLSRTVDAELASDIEKHSVYVSEDLLSLSVVQNEPRVLVGYKDGADIERLQEKLSRYLDAMLARVRRVEPAVHYQRGRRSKAIEHDVFPKLLERGWAFQHGRGMVSLSGPALTLSRVIDETFARRYRRSYAAQDRAYPAMIQAELLARCGYFEMHPNAVSFVSHLRNDFDEIESFRAVNEGASRLNVTHGGAFAPIQHCLNPAACFPCYEAFENHRIGAEGQVLTWPARVFRYESSNLVGLDRLWEFNVRELVFLGTDAFVQAGRRKAIALIQEILDDWDLSGRIETATDPFFATVYASKAFWQEAMDVKYEIRLDIAPKSNGTARTVAAGSINLHGAFFGERFNIRDANGEAAYSGCVGWGLERWVLAIFSQHGFDVQKWPERLQERVLAERDDS
ncbi:aminoacyl--tRNA ligase-related protein [Pendulispora albinea]|uniref:Aminoacyl-transfer RNA synthetases class-II family profile domain-containing protein n=1 Tax=Pendulispora albinea TaxID=2741071 RepID=A0ABZ2MAB1_9BACT